MRLESVDSGHSWGARMKFRAMRLAMGVEPDILKALGYRPELWGDAMKRLIQAVLRGPSAWSVADRELLASFVSSRNQCVFCTRTHGAVASKQSGDEARTAAVLEDFRAAPIPEELRATLALLEKLTLTPAEVTPADVDAVRARGVSDQAIEDAIYICFVLSFLNRVGDTLRFQLPEGAEAYQVMARFLLLLGYR